MRFAACTLLIYLGAPAVRDSARLSTALRACALRHHDQLRAPPFWSLLTITDRVLEGMAEWQSRPLDAVYPVLFIDCVNVKIRDGNVANRPIYVALAVTVDGTRDILGLWAGEHGDGEGAKYWLRVLSARSRTAAWPTCWSSATG